MITVMVSRYAIDGKPPPRQDPTGELFKRCLVERLPERLRVICPKLFGKGLTEFLSPLSRLTIRRKPPTRSPPQSPLFTGVSCEPKSTHETRG